MERERETDDSEVFLSHDFPAAYSDDRILITEYGVRNKLLSDLAAYVNVVMVPLFMVGYMVS